MHLYIYRSMFYAYVDNLLGPTFLFHLVYTFFLNKLFKELLISYFKIIILSNEILQSYTRSNTRGCYIELIMSYSEVLTLFLYLYLYSVELMSTMFQSKVLLLFLHSAFIIYNSRSSLKLKCYLNYLL